MIGTLLGENLHPGAENILPGSEDTQMTGSGVASAQSHPSLTEAGLSTFFLPPLNHKRFVSLVEISLSRLKLPHRRSS